MDALGRSREAMLFALGGLQLSQRAGTITGQLRAAMNLSNMQDRHELYAVRPRFEVHDEARSLNEDDSLTTARQEL